MAKKIIWSPRSVIAHQRIINYLQQNWSDKEIRNFISLTAKTIELLASDKIKFRYSKKRKIYEVLVTRHNLLLYREKKDSIELITFWDTRQNPKKKLKD